jgi:hypothetical protein
MVSISLPACPLARYEAACRAVAKAKSIDEVRDIHGQADAMRAYARQAKNKQLEIDASEIRFRAERRIGELGRAMRSPTARNPRKSVPSVSPISPAVGDKTVTY